MKKQTIFRVRGYIDARDALLVITKAHQPTLVSSQDFPPEIRIKVTETFRDMKLGKKFRKGEVSKLPNDFGKLKFVEIRSEDQQLINELYAEIKPYLVKDTSRI